MSKAIAFFTQFLRDGLSARNGYRRSAPFVSIVLKHVLKRNIYLACVATNFMRPNSFAPFDECFQMRKPLVFATT